MAIKPLFRLLVAALNAQFNNLVMATVLVDVRGALGISRDPRLWIGSLYASGVVLGMALSPPACAPAHVELDSIVRHTGSPAAPGSFQRHP
ncbi:hypothetical protein [Methylobacterium durans]|uniref:hypothetical protein n=1 Tax=Methylobacterium durans TaxID=2202825 RepID=UPI00187F1B0A|nr:hypothetical protein [Methylobacterium durans]